MAKTSGAVKRPQYLLPSLDFLQPADIASTANISKKALATNARIIRQTLAAFDIEVAVGDITVSPTITRYEIRCAPGVKLETIQTLAGNLAAALMAESIHILPPVPGRKTVGIEIPNLVRTKAPLRKLLESEAWRNAGGYLPIALGQDEFNQPVVADLAEMSHLLIGGGIDSGKSVCLNAIIASLLCRFSPDQLRFLMIDPKAIELQSCKALPHLVAPVATDPKKALLALRWVIAEMEKRHQIFAQAGVRNIRAFNERAKTKSEPARRPSSSDHGKKGRTVTTGLATMVDEAFVTSPADNIFIPEKLSYLVVIINELADLMLAAPAEGEMAIARLTQWSRAAGIHCIIATQRPNPDVITGAIKANIPARIAFQVGSRVDSRTIIDAPGADKLLGKGDMLYRSSGSKRIKRLQGCFISETEMQALVDCIARQGIASRNCRGSRAAAGGLI